MRCGECSFFQPVTATEGECRANPPAMFLVPVQGLQGSGVGFASQFPKVSAEAWCGPFEIHAADDDGANVVMLTAQ